MRRRVLQATIAAVTVAVVLLGFPLAFLGAQLVRESEMRGLEARATSAARAVDFRIDQQIDLTDTMLTSRKSAMKEALRGLPTAAALALDFYDRARIATWVRDHPGLIPWVRERIGRSLRGWRSFGRWSSRPADADAGYLIDDAVRIRMPGEDVGDLTGILDRADWEATAWPLPWVAGRPDPGS